MTDSAIPSQPRWPKRYTMIALCSLAMVVCYLDRVNISIAIIPMQQQFGWNDNDVGSIMSAFFIGYLLMQVGGGYLANRFGGKTVLGLAVILWSLFTILTPVAALMSLPALLMMRLLLGLGEASLSPSGLTLFGKWIPEQERSRAVAIFSAAAILGTVIALLTAPRIIGAYGWPAVFYVYGALGFIWAIFWYRMVYESPDTHPNVSTAESNFLKDKVVVKNEKNEQVPWKQIFSQRPIWALFVAYFSLSWGLYVFLSWLPKYFSDAHQLDISGSSTYALFPWITMFVMIIVAGWIADKLANGAMSLTTVRKLMQSIGLFLPAAMMLLLRDVGSAEVAVVLMCLCLGFLAFGYSGAAPNALDLSPRFAGIVFGAANTFGTLAGAISGKAVGYILTATGSYDMVFLVSAIILIIGGVVFLLFGTAKEIIK